MRRPTRTAVRRRSHRRGQMLLLMFLFLLAVLAMLALIVDLGFARLAQRSMRSAVSTAALEGLRGRGVPEYDETTRRTNAQLLLRRSFDEDLDLGTSNVGTTGAGIQEVIDGNGFRSTTIITREDFAADRASRVYRPDDFQLNIQNAIHGDMVIGDHTEPAETALLAGVLSRELASYERTDFSNTGDRAFLVRMRRTHNPLGLDEVDDVSSRGDPLPVWFGRLNWIRAAEAGEDYSARRDGLTVRATAIAEGRPARSVGRAYPEFQLPGVAPFELTLDFWLGRDESPADSDWDGNPLTPDATTGESLVVQLETDGTLYRTGQTTRIGHVIVLPETVLSSGDPTVDSAAAAALTFPINQYRCIVPLVAAVPLIDGGEESRVIGFGWATLTEDDDPATPATEVQLTRYSGPVPLQEDVAEGEEKQVPRVNALPTWFESADNDVDWLSPDLRQLLGDLEGRYPLLAPALVR